MNTNTIDSRNVRMEEMRELVKQDMGIDCVGGLSPKDIPGELVVIAMCVKSMNTQGILNYLKDFMGYTITCSKAAYSEA